MKIIALIKLKHVCRLLVLSSLIASIGCEDFLSERTSKKLVLPETVRDLQALLDYSNVIKWDPAQGEVATDDYYLSDANWSALTREEDRRAYIWEPDYSTYYISWFFVYRNVNYANVILDHVDNIPRKSHTEADRLSVKGQALFLRARSFLSAAVIWGPGYEPGAAEQQLGIPLPLTDDYNLPTPRKSLAETYQQIISDLKESIPLLPERPYHATRSSKPAAHALLARAYLFMHEYDSCAYYASQSLAYQNTMMDYTSLNPNDNFPFPEYGEEVIYDSRIYSLPPLYPNVMRVSPELMALYERDDPRKSLFFRENSGEWVYRGSHAGVDMLFSGLAVDEVILMRAESKIRTGNRQEGESDLRWFYLQVFGSTKGEELAALSDAALLDRVLLERRKHLIFRGVRWPDIKRLNVKGRGISLTRTVHGVQYHLPANDYRFALAIPEEVLERAPELQQNPR